MRFELITHRQLCTHMLTILRQKPRETTQINIQNASRIWKRISKNWMSTKFPKSTMNIWIVPETSCPCCEHKKINTKKAKLLLLWCLSNPTIIYPWLDVIFRCTLIGASRGSVCPDLTLFWNCSCQWTDRHNISAYRPRGVATQDSGTVAHNWSQRRTSIQTPYTALETR